VLLSRLIVRNALGWGSFDERSRAAGWLGRGDNAATAAPAGASSITSTRRSETVVHRSQNRAHPGDLPSPDAGDFAERRWCSPVAQLQFTGCRWSASAKFDQIEPERF